MTNDPQTPSDPAFTFKPFTTGQALVLSTLLLGSVILLSTYYVLATWYALNQRQSLGYGLERMGPVLPLFALVCFGLALFLSIQLRPHFFQKLFSGLER